MDSDTNTIEFFVKIIQSLSWLILWMIIQLFVGVYLNYAFFDSSPGWPNFLYYIFLIGSGYFVMKMIIKKWKISRR